VQEHVMNDATGTPLAVLLARAGMSPPQLAGDINRWLERHGLGARRIHPTAPYSWVRKDYKPYEPVPAAVAAVLSERLGELVTVADLWPGRAASCAAATAVSGLDGFRCPGDAVEALAGLIAGTPQITPSAGPDLAAAVNETTTAAVAVARHHGGGAVVSHAGLMAGHVAEMRRLDDRHGGGGLNLRYITGQLRVALDLARGPGGADAGHQLLTVIADLAQLSGWASWDSCLDGIAQRYLLLSQYLASAAGEHGRAANAVGMLSYASAFAGHGDSAIRIASAAEYLCPPVPLLRARISGRMATAYAVAGDTAGFRAAAGASLGHLDRHGAGPAPSYLYYLQPEQLLSEQGQALVVLAARSQTGRTRLLREAVDLLAPISGRGARPQYPRSALLHGAFLARAYLLSGDLDAAVEAVRAALTRLPDVQSARGTAYLRELRRDLVRRQRARPVAAFLPELDAILGHDR
jgi:hypothetical protein